MGWARVSIGLIFGAALIHGAALAQELPHFQRNGEAVQLIVEGTPYLALAGELHNSSASSPSYMAPIWDRLAKSGVRTVIGTASWELVEPTEGSFDFTAVDDQISQARSHNMHLILIWFGAYKNAESKYAPSWVRRNEIRFPRALRETGSDDASETIPVLSVFNDRLADADARAFTALMHHVRQVDQSGTVIMMQVENEVGMMGAARDHSGLANKAWAQQVPADLMDYLSKHRSDLRPELAEIWARQGYRNSGTWAEVFGTDAHAGEIFMAWGFGSYVNRVAKAGMAEYALPTYTNAWLGPQPGATNPGDYPSGGPVARMMDVWKAAAPSLQLLSPDIYVDDFSGTLADFRRADNPIFIPEARFDAGNLCVALGQYNAIAFSPFGIEDGGQDSDVFQAYRLLNEMTAQITSAQAEGRIRGFRIAGGSQQKLAIGGYDISITGPQSTVGAFGPGTGATEAASPKGYGLVIQTGKDEFLVAGRAISLNFSASGAKVEIDSAQEGVFDNEKWVAGRTLNGDERWNLFPGDHLQLVRVKLLKR